MKFIFAKVGHKVQQLFRFVVHRAARDNPTHVRPQSALARRVRIAFHVRKLVVNSMSRHPRNRSAFESQRPASRQEVLHPFRCFVSAMRQQPVIAHADPETSGNPPKHKRNRKRFEVYINKHKKEPPSRPDNWVN